MNVTDRDLGYRKIMRDFQSINGKSVVAGVLKGAGNEPNGAALVNVARWNEFGTSRIPPRPFVRLSYENNHPKWESAAEKVAEDIICRRGFNAAMKELGGIMRDDIKKIIGDKTLLAPNAPSTIRKKGHDKPLIDKGKLKACINFRIDG